MKKQKCENALTRGRTSRISASDIDSMIIGEGGQRAAAAGDAAAATA